MISIPFANATKEEAEQCRNGSENRELGLRGSRSQHESSRQCAAHAVSGVSVNHADTPSAGRATQPPGATWDADILKEDTCVVIKRERTKDKLRQSMILKVIILSAELECH